MFGNILTVVSSESYQEEVLKRSVFLAEKFKGNLDLIYVIEQKPVDEIDKHLDPLTFHQRNKTKKDVITGQRNIAEDIIFDYMEVLLENKEIPFKKKIKKGKFSDVVKSETSKNNYDLIVIGFEKGCMLRYRIIEESDIPIWIEIANNRQKSILAVCSNLAPNQKVPQMSRNIAETLGWDFHIIYVVDMEDAVEVDVNEKRSVKKSKQDLLSNGQTFAKEMEQNGIDVQMVQGGMQNEILKAAERLNPGVIVMGREQKKKGMLNFPIKSFKRKITRKCEYPMLFTS